jgi:hypothetical protein
MSDFSPRKLPVFSKHYKKCLNILQKMKKTFCRVAKDELHLVKIKLAV